MSAKAMLSLWIICTFILLAAAKPTLEEHQEFGLVRDWRRKNRSVCTGPAKHLFVLRLTRDEQYAIYPYIGCVPFQGEEICCTLTKQHIDAADNANSEWRKEPHSQTEDSISPSSIRSVLWLNVAWALANTCKLAHGLAVYLQMAVASALVWTRNAITRYIVPEAVWIYAMCRINHPVAEKLRKARYFEDVVAALYVLPHVLRLGLVLVLSDRSGLGPGVSKGFESWAFALRGAVAFLVIVPFVAMFELTVVMDESESAARPKRSPGASSNGDCGDDWVEVDAT